MYANVVNLFTSFESNVGVVLTSPSFTKCPLVGNEQTSKSTKAQCQNSWFVNLHIWTPLFQAQMNTLPTPSPWLRHKANRGWRAVESPSLTFDEGDLMGDFGLGLLPDCDTEGAYSDRGEIFGHNRLRSECLQVQPVTRWRLPVFLY